MDSAATRDHLIEAVSEHCLAFKDHISLLKGKQYAAGYPKQLLTFLEAVNNSILQNLTSLHNDPDFQNLADREAEQHVLRYTQLYSYLYIAASLIERSDAPHTIIELIQPLKRLIQRQLGECEIIIRPLDVLNYSFYHLGNNLLHVILELDIPDLPGNLPRHLMAIGFPGLELDRFLTHCVVAHEIGHCLYSEYKLQDILLPKLHLDEDQLNKMVQVVAKTDVQAGFQGKSNEATIPLQRTLSEYVSELEIRRCLTADITRISRLWIKELTCDAIGYCLIGPAFLFSVLNFMTTVALFDDDRTTHPPNRMRLLLLYQLLDREQLEDSEIMTHEVLGLLKSWKNVMESQPPQFTDPLRKIASDSIKAINDSIIDAAESAVQEIGVYSFTQHIPEIKLLMERVKQLIPPNEIIEAGAAQSVSFQSVLNAGWLAYISHINHLADKYKWDSWKTKCRLNALVAKAVELNEIQKRWSEIN